MIIARPRLGYILAATATIVVVMAAVFFQETEPRAALVGAWNMTDQGVAISGYDTVAYFTEGKPQKGDAEFQHDWQDATWQFANQSHRDLFAADPESYVPEFGGFCAAAMSYSPIRSRPGHGGNKKSCQRSSGLRCRSLASSNRTHRGRVGHAIRYQVLLS